MKFTNRNPWNRLLLLFGVLLLSVLHPHPARAQDEYDQTEFNLFDWELEQTSQLIVMLSVEYAGAPEFGSGIIFGRERDRLFIATAYHVLHRGAEHPVVHVTFKTAPDKALVAKLLKHDENMDLAVLSVEGLAMQNVNPCALNFARLGNAQRLSRGAPVLAVGNPNGVQWAYSVQPDLVVRTSTKEVVFQSTFIRRGHSGGALINKNGHIVGMTTADEPPFGRATDVDGALEMVKQWGYPVHLRRALASGMTPLHHVARVGDLVAISSLLADCGPDPRDRLKATPLHYAAAHEKSEAMALLLKARADVNALDRDGDPPLEWAISEKRTENVKILVEAGAKLDIQRFSALQLATNLGLETILFLLQRGANVNPPADGDTPLHSVVESKQVEAARALLKAGARANAKGRRGRTPLAIAVKLQQVELVAMLLDAGAKADSVDEESEPILRTAVTDNNLEIVKLLVAKGSNVNASYDGTAHSTALHAAVGSDTGNLEIAKVLIKAGANINARTTRNQTPLYSAAHSKREDAVRLLVQAGADVNARDIDNNTPLLEAIKHNLPNAVKILLQAGADVNIKNNEGYTALYLAEYSTPAIADLLRRHRPK